MSTSATSRISKRAISITPLSILQKCTRRVGGSVRPTAGASNSPAGKLSHRTSGGPANAGMGIQTRESKRRPRGPCWPGLQTQEGRRSSKAPPSRLTERPVHWQSQNVNRGADTTTHATDIAEVHDSAGALPGDAGQEAPAPGPRIALLTPYTGGNLGDAAIQDALIANLRLRLPAVQFSGICLNGDNFVERHGSGFFPLCGSDGQFYRMYSGKLTDQPADRECPTPIANEEDHKSSSIKQAARQVPGCCGF